MNTIHRASPTFTRDVHVSALGLNYLTTQVAANCIFNDLFLHGKIHLPSVGLYHMKANGTRTKRKHINNFMGLFESSHVLKIPINSCRAITSHLPRTLLRNKAILRKQPCKKCTDYPIVRSIKPLSICLYRLYYDLFPIIYQIGVVEAASSSLVTQTKQDSVEPKGTTESCFFYISIANEKVLLEKSKTKCSYPLQI